jgi:hypothetical protein
MFDTRIFIWIGLAFAACFVAGAVALTILQRRRATQMQQDAEDARGDGPDDRFTARG